MSKVFEKYKNVVLEKTQINKQLGIRKSDRVLAKDLIDYLIYTCIIVFALNQLGMEIKASNLFGCLTLGWISTMVLFSDYNIITYIIMGISIFFYDITITVVFLAFSILSVFNELMKLMNYPFSPLIETLLYLNTITYMFFPFIAIMLLIYKEQNIIIKKRLIDSSLYFIPFGVAGLLLFEVTLMNRLEIIFPTIYLMTAYISFFIIYAIFLVLPYYVSIRKDKQKRIDTINNKIEYLTTKHPKHHYRQKALRKLLTIENYKLQKLKIRKISLFPHTKISSLLFFILNLFISYCFKQYIFVFILELV